MHTVQLLLKPSKYERHEIERRFRALAHLHNVCVKHARKCMIRLQHDKRYAELKQLYSGLLKKDKLSKKEKSQKKEFAKQLNDRRIELGLSKAALEHYLKVCGKRFSRLLSSQQVQVEADRVWCGVEKCLFGNGKGLHFKKFMDFDTIGGKSNKNGARFDRDTMYVNWLGLSFKCYLPKSESSLSYVCSSGGQTLLQISYDLKAYSQVIKGLTNNCFVHYLILSSKTGYNMDERIMSRMKARSYIGPGVR